jgi:hypothetical protein
MNFALVEAERNIKSVVEVEMNLISEMEKALPMYAYPTNHLLKVIDKKLNLRLTSRLEITSLMDAGHAGGITCGIQLSNQVVLV